MKIDFETYLLRKYPKHAIGYKINKLKSLATKVYKPKDVEMEIFKQLERSFLVASKNYKITPYHKDVLVFYAKDQYYFWDKDKDVRFKKWYLNGDTKNLWKQYVKSVTMYEIEGDHSTMFYSAKCKGVC